MLNAEVRRESGDEEIDEMTRSWWALPLVGVLGIIVGAVVLAKPSHSLATIAVISGVFVLVDSIIELGVALLRRRSGAEAVLGVLGIVFGILLIRHPVVGVLAIAVLVGIWLVARGMLRLVRTLALADSWWQVALAVLEIVAGIVIVSSPHVGFSALALLVGISFIANGVGMVLVGLLTRSLRQEAPSSVAQPGLDRSPSPT